jgi:peptidoglycan/xylan/chitin deacetylase (PgdA/CDA1 family)
MTTICLTFDFDALSIWVSTFKLTSPTPLSRGEYGARVGLGRVLKLLERHAVPATFFVPAHTAASFSDAVRSIAAAGHEIAAHGFVHESPVALTRAEEVELLIRSEDVLANVTGARPVGYRSPAWDLSPHTMEILEERGYLYDSSLMADDFTPYRPRRGDVVTEAGFARGPACALIEFPVAWELDDYPYFQFMSRPINQGLRDPAEVGAIWQAEFDYCRTQVTDGVFSLTNHPEIIGRGPRIEMLDRLVAHMKRQNGVKFSNLRDEARRRLSTGRDRPAALARRRI